MSERARLDLPDGRVPSYKEFRKHVWSYTDEEGLQAVKAPPWMFSVVVVNAHEMHVLRGTMAMAETSFGLNPEYVKVEPGSARGSGIVSFRDLASLYYVLVPLTWRAALDADHATRCASKALAEVFLWSLGFRWV